MFYFYSQSFCFCFFSSTFHWSHLLQMPQIFVPSFLHHLLRSKNHHPGNLIPPLFGYSFVQQIIIYLCGNHVTAEGNKTLSWPPRTQTNRTRDRTTVQRESLQWWLEASSSHPPQAQTFPFSRPLLFPALWQKGKLAPKSELQRVEPLYDWKEKVSNKMNVDYIQHST